MPSSVRAYAKINVGLYIGTARADGFHQLSTIYRTIDMHDVVRVTASAGTGIEIRCKNPQVPQDESNTCWRVAERVLRALKQRRRVVIQIEKNLPVQGGLGAGSSNAVATMLALERELGKPLPAEDKLSIAVETGSDVPLFLIGGAVLGLGHGEQVFPLAEPPLMHLVVATPNVGISTPKAFADWDSLTANERTALTPAASASRIDVFSRSMFAWLAGSLSGVPVKDRDRAETPLLDLVRAGIENDFERVVFPQYPELREVKRVLEREGARYASLSGSGSALYGIFDTAEAAEKAAGALKTQGIEARATNSLSREQYWKNLVISVSK
ncbi:MAG TPA: 4-(cytidine 5'-diphospho)-2-C-methyl-D-erythritol kinase [Terriglobales bacterium]|nr:4-(cytidine 5'-diphospho)-2-C-methyl-D-erythritol kinase [Terriglobales bacterium]